MIAKPIPRHLLIHSIIYEEYLSEGDGWDPGYAAPVTIDFVRVQGSDSLKRSSDSVSRDSSLVVFVDRTNSSQIPKFKKQSKVTFDNETYELIDPKPFYDENPEVPHHYELGLK